MTLVFVVKMVVISVISYFAFYINIEQIVDENIKWTRYPSQIARFMGSTWGPPWDDRTQVGPMLDPWTLLSGMITISQIADNQITCTYGHIVCFKFRHKKSVGHFVKSSRKVHCDCTNGTIVIWGLTPIFSQTQNNVLTTVPFSVGGRRWNQ